MGSVSAGAWKLELLDFGRRIGVVDTQTGEVVRRFDTRPEEVAGMAGKPKPKPRPKPKPTGY